MAYKPPTYTQVPNLLLDKHVQRMSKAELKIILATCRKTFGWQKGKDRISYTQFEQLTGLSRASVQEGIKQAVAHGYLRRYEVRNGFEYALTIDSIPEFELGTIPEIEHTKETIKEKVHAKDFDSLATSKKPTVFANYPVDVQAPLLVFKKHFPMVKVDSKPKWIKQARVWVEMELTINDIEKMCEYAKKNWPVAQPASITSAYNMMKNTKKEYDPVAERARSERG